MTDELQDPYGSTSSLEGAFTQPFSIDVSPLQKLLVNLANQVEKLQADNVSLREELANMKVDKRLEALESGLQELAETAKPASGYGQAAAVHTFSPYFLQGGAGGTGGAGGAAAAAAAAAAAVAGGAPGSAAGGAAGAQWQTGGGAEGGVAASMPSMSGAMAAMGALAGAMFPGATPHGSTAGGMPPMAPGMAADSSWVMFEFTGLKERLNALERKSEALWHVKEGGEEVRVLVERLKTDVESVQSNLTEMQGASRHASHMVEKLDTMNNQAREQMSDIIAKMNVLENEDKKAATERREAGSKVEAHVNSIWDQMRHVENSLSQRLTLAETSQVSTLQEVDEQKEAANELLMRLEEAKRHTAALENKLDSFNTQVAAAISPLHTSLANVQVRLEELAANKQDADKALTMNDVNAAAARAVDHADRRADNIIKSIGAMEERLEALDEAKAALADVVLSVDLEALLSAHAQQLDAHLALQKEEIMKAVGLKSDREEVVALEQRQGARLGVLEAAILKGLRSVSDKVAAALAEKLDLTRFSEFKVQVRAILSDIEDRLKDWSPAARGMKAPLDGSGAQGATSCLCCDSRVRSVRDLHSMGFHGADKVLSPERLPASEPLLPAINRSPDVAAYTNAKLSARKKETAAMLRASMPHIDAGSPAGMLAVSQATGSPTGGSLLSVLDPAALLGAKGEVKGKPPPPSVVPNSLPAPGGGHGTLVKVDVETISGAISQGRLPDTRNPGRGPSNGNASGKQLSQSMNRAPSEGVGAWAAPGSVTGGTGPLDLSIDMRPHRPDDAILHA